ncbi:MAG TPA: hypothetical protein VGI10_29730 [Polyangiaceae bacterium]|jgi:hypothetical protein
MTVEATGSSNYMSDSEIMAWMEQKTEGLYQSMRDSMDVANRRADLESALGDMQGLLADTKTGEASADQVYAKMGDLLDQYKDFPEVTQMLEPMYATMTTQRNAAGQQAAQVAATNEHNAQLQQAYIDQHPGQHPPDFGAQQPTPPPFSVSAADADAWGAQMKDKVDYLGKQDQLGLINIQDVNSQINQAKEIASNLIDSQNKSASAVVANIRA